VLSVLSLEETGARGNKGLAGLVDNPVHSNAIAGLATSATAQATVEVPNRIINCVYHNSMLKDAACTAVTSIPQHHSCSNLSNLLHAHIQ
jgi:hypothetical protein